MTDDKRETAERPALKRETVQAAGETGRLSETDEARSYIAGFLELEYLDDLAAVLQAAEQITGASWAVVVTSEGAEIKNLEEEQLMDDSADEASGDDDEDGESGDVEETETSDDAEESDAEESDAEDSDEEE
jgi:hypothetical protein